MPRRRGNVYTNQMNLFDWADKQAAERNRRQKEEEKGIHQEKIKRVEDNSLKSIHVPKVLLDWPIEELELTIRTK